MTLEAGLIPLAIIGVLTSVASAFYYMRVIVNMYLRDDQTGAAVGETPRLNWATYITFAGTLILGLLPVLATTFSDRVVLALVP